MRVHVPETGHQVLPGTIDDAGGAREARSRRRRYCDDAVAFDQRGLIAEQSSSLDVDYSDMSDDEIGFSDSSAAGRGSTASKDAG
jgi:hypothetical protein